MDSTGPGRRAGSCCFGTGSGREGDMMFGHMSHVALVVLLTVVVTMPVTEAIADDPLPGTSVIGKMGTRAQSKELPVLRSDWSVYIDPTYHFSVSYPQGFVVRTQDVPKQSEVTPRLVAAIIFMNPTMATGALAGREPPDLDVRIFESAKQDSLKAWLMSVGFASAEDEPSIQPYRNAAVSGLRVCHSTLVAPGCSIYVLHERFVYQLTTISREGEAMLETFSLSPQGGGGRESK